MKPNIIMALVALGLGIFLLMTLSSKDSQSTVLNKNLPGKEESAKLVEIPAGMPSNVPLYPGAVLSRVQDTDQAEERNITLTLMAEATVADVNTWYRRALSANGWSVTDDKVVAGYELLKSENENVTVFIQSAANTKAGQVTITQRIRVR